MKTVSVYTRSGAVSGSSYYRILQYEKDINCKFLNRIVVPQKIYNNYNKSVGCKRRFFQILFYFFAYTRVITFLIKDIFKKPDILFVSRAIMPKIAPFPIIPLMKKAFKSAKKVVWDIDDDIFQAKEITHKETAALKKFADKIIITTQDLKKYFSDNDVYDIIQLLTTDGDFIGDDINQLLEVRKKRYDDGELALVWLATYTSLPFLEDVVPYLDEAARIIKETTQKTVVLEIVCNRALNVKTENLKINNLTWTRNLAHERAQNALIGIYPLRNTLQAKGKSGFKLLQYMSIALPTISSDVGETKKIVTSGVNGVIVSTENLSQWKDALIELTQSWEALECIGRKAKKTWDNDYSYAQNLKTLTDIFCGESK